MQDVLVIMLQNSSYMYMSVHLPYMSIAYILEAKCGAFWEVGEEGREKSQKSYNFREYTVYKMLMILLLVQAYGNVPSHKFLSMNTFINLFTHNF